MVLGMFSLWVFYIGGLVGSFSARTKAVAEATILACFILSTVVKAAIIFFGLVIVCGGGALGWGEGAFCGIWCLINGSLFFGGARCCLGDGATCCTAHPKVWLAIAVVLQLIACFNSTVVHSTVLEIGVAVAGFCVVFPVMCYLLYNMCSMTYTALKHRRVSQRCPRTICGIIVCAVVTMFAAATAVVAEVYLLLQGKHKL